jgi:hypothetical protein
VPQFPTLYVALGVFTAVAVDPTPPVRLDGNSRGSASSEGSHPAEYT